MSDPITIFVAPSEHHPAMRAIADRTSNLPETYGCDVIWRAHEQWWGVQRKEIKDFMASVMDGRLSKELGQMRGHVAIPLVVIEGKVHWSTDGIMMHSTFGQTITRAAYHGMLFSVVHEGANVFFTNSTQETADLCLDLAAWSQKESHTSMRNRPGPGVTSMWGKATNVDWARHLLQGFPGIGAGMAQQIIDHFGRVPLKWDVTIPELIKVPGIGKVRAKALIEAFETITEGTTNV